MHVEAEEISTKTRSDCCVNLASNMDSAACSMERVQQGTKISYIHYPRRRVASESPVHRFFEIVHGNDRIHCTTKNQSEYKAGGTA
jgi:hypothetical protein